MKPMLKKEGEALEQAAQAPLQVPDLRDSNLPGLEVNDAQGLDFVSERLH